MVTQRALAAAVLLLALGAACVLAEDADLQRAKDYKRDSYDKHDKYESKKDYGHKEPSDKHVRFDVAEKVDATHPCDASYEILGATVAQNADLLFEGKVVGEATWSGIVVKRRAHDYGAHSSRLRVNYEVVLSFFAKEYEGEVVCGGVGESIFSEETEVLAVLGGTGAFVGASGTVTWSTGKNGGVYSLDLTVPQKRDYGYEYKYLN